MVVIREYEEADFESLVLLLNAYKREIGEVQLTEDDQNRIRQAIREGRIIFFVAVERRMIGMCSLSLAFSTFGGGRPCGVFEDFYIVPESRKTGIASRLTEYLFREARKRSCSSVIVGCSPSDVPMYRHLGFTTAIGQMLSKLIT